MRAFSTAKSTITGDRNQLGASMIEAPQLQKNLLRNKVVNSHTHDLEAVIKSLEKPAPILLEID